MTAADIKQLSRWHTRNPREGHLNITKRTVAALDAYAAHLTAQERADPALTAGDDWNAEFGPMEGSGA